MEREDAQTAIRLLGQIYEAQAANLEVQRKLLDTVVAQAARNEEMSKRAGERTTLLQDRTMEMLILNRRILSYGLPIIVVVVVFIWVLFRLPRWG
jgi:hypothetical protein